MREALYGGLDALGANRLLRHLRRDHVAVLMYHGLVPAGSGIRAWTMVDQDGFRCQLSHLRDHCDVVSIAEALAPGRRTGHRRRVVLTFDDGYRSVYELAFPLLREFGMPATVFVTTAFVDTDGMFWYDRIIGALQDQRIDALDAGAFGLGRFPLAARSPADRWDRIQDVLEAVKWRAYDRREAIADWIAAQHPIPDAIRDRFGMLRTRDLREMVASGLVEAGSHTHRHEILTQIDGEAAGETIRTSLQELAAMTGRAVTTLSYPNGDHDPAITACVARHGVAAAFTTRSGDWMPGTDPMRIPRYGVSAFDSEERFRAIVSGLAGLVQA